MIIFNLISMKKLYISLIFLMCWSLSAPQEVSQEEVLRAEAIEKEARKAAPKDSLVHLIKNNPQDFIVISENISRTSGTRNIYLRQALNGLEVFGTESSIHYHKDGSVLKENNRFIPRLAETVKSNSQSISARQAVVSVASKMNYPITDLQEISGSKGKNDPYIFNKAGISLQNIPVKLMYYYRERAGTYLVWELSIGETTSSDWWNFRVDAASGAIIDKDNWTVSCDLGDHAHHHSADDGKFIGPVEKPLNYSAAVETVQNPTAQYRVFPIPVESPNYGPRSLVVNPENLTASPYGWHDTDGNPGAEYTYTRGNNTETYADDDGNNLPDGKYAYSPGGNLIFDFPLDLNFSYNNRSQDAAVTNLFYWTNIIHDVMYLYGFDEASGNFQENNYGRGGIGNDPVNAEAQDGLGTCNANFTTLPDGNRPRMQMYVCGNRDGDLDNLVIVHEYGHGISNRLTGGPTNVSCLRNQEQMGEGWSDYFGLMLTMTASDTGSQARGIGTWLFGEGPGGPGIRTYPYSTDFSVNPHTYDAIKTAAVPHGVGSVWAAMLWEMTWEIMAEVPFDPDIYNGSGGNNIALALVTEGLRLQPCSPGFVDGRDAILAADQALFDGAYQCAIWRAFARRGLGYSANQGSSGSSSDGTEAFDLPPSFASLNVVEEVCLAGGIQTGLSGGLPAGGVYSGPGVTDDGNGTTFTFDPAVAGTGITTITYTVDDPCEAGTAVLTDEINVTDHPPAVICKGSGTLVEELSYTAQPNLSIPDNNSNGVVSTITVSENVIVHDLDVSITITHPWVGDLAVSLKSPAGTTVTLVDRPGRAGSGYGCSGSNIQAVLDDDAATFIHNECAPTTPTIDGRFKPNNPLAAFNGENAQGVWEIRVSDRASGLTGTFNSWGMELEYQITADPLAVTLDENGEITINAEDLLFEVSTDCGGYSVLAGDPLSQTISFSCEDVGSHTIPVQVTGDTGVTTSCNAIVIVSGGSGTGSLDCPADITQSSDPGSCGAVITYSVATPDICEGGGGNLTQTGGLPSGSVFPVGTTVNSFVYDDGVNPPQTCSFEVTITDEEPPVAVCKDITVVLDSQTGTATIAASDIDDGSSDACGIANLEIDKNSFDCSDIGTNSVTLTVTDTNGNTAECVAIVTVTDQDAPVIDCPDSQTIVLDPGTSHYVLPDYFGTGQASATDNCTAPVTEVSQDPAPGTQLTAGVHTITLHAEDESGNSASCDFEITVEMGLGTQNPDLKNLVLYPNPAGQQLNLSNPSGIPLTNLFIYDLRGRIIKTVDLRNMESEKTIRVDNLEAALYFVLIEGEKGQITKWFIKE